MTMLRWIQPLLFGLFFATTSLAQNQSLTNDSATIAPPGPVLITNGNLVDVETGRVREGMSLFIENGIIRKIGKNLSTAAGTTVVRKSYKTPGSGSKYWKLHSSQAGAFLRDRCIGDIVIQ